MGQLTMCMGFRLCVSLLVSPSKRFLVLVSCTIQYLMIRGKGAFLNGNCVQVSSKTQLIQCLLATETGTKRDKETINATTKRINSFLCKMRSIRMAGSCAMDLCGIASGRLDLMYEVGYGGPWDVAAGVVIVREAGGVVYDPSGKDFDVTVTRIAASNPHIKDAFIDVFQQAEKE